ncbi:hypothetical protein DFJ74DRAFT_310919 [Hyaloraphidium curvatum]|nr:hypothetical protein DFJ74DRAFT_310919 [Hyaloraphidium curvatum]
MPSDQRADHLVDALFHLVLTRVERQPAQRRKHRLLRLLPDRQLLPGHQLGPHELLAGRVSCLRLVHEILPLPDLPQPPRRPLHVCFAPHVEPDPLPVIPRVPLPPAGRVRGGELRLAQPVGQLPLGDGAGHLARAAASPSPGGVDLAHPLRAAEGAALGGVLVQHHGHAQVRLDGEHLGCERFGGVPREAAVRRRRGGQPEVPEALVEHHRPQLLRDARAGEQLGRLGELEHLAGDLGRELPKTEAWGGAPAGTLGGEAARAEGVAPRVRSSMEAMDVIFRSWGRVGCSGCRLNAAGELLFGRRGSRVGWTTRQATRPR